MAIVTMRLGLLLGSVGIVKAVSHQLKATCQEADARPPGKMDVFLATVPRAVATCAFSL